MIAQGQIDAGKRLLEEVFRQLPKDRVPIRIMLHCGLLVCEAHSGDWTGWDHHCSTIVRMVEQSDYVDADVAYHLEQAGTLAIDAGEIQRGRTALVVSKGLYLALGRTEDAEAVNVRLHS